jgi:hypothetical protein
MALQDLDTFVISIIHPEKNRVIGTGFIVTLDGLVATCRHIFVNSGMSTDVGTSIKIRFRNSSETSAKVEIGLEEYDISILKLIDGLPIGATNAILGRSAHSNFHNFISKGYPSLGVYEGIPVEGRILGSVERVSNKSALRFTPLILDCRQADVGISGAPVLDTETDLIIGMITSIWRPPDEGTRNPYTTFAIPSEALALAHPRVELESVRVTSQEFDLQELELLLALHHYRILSKEVFQDSALFHCENLLGVDIPSPVLVYVVNRKSTPGDEEKLHQALIKYDIAEGMIVEIE